MHKHGEGLLKETDHAGSPDGSHIHCDSWVPSLRSPMPLGYFQLFIIISNSRPTTMYRNSKHYMARVQLQ